MCNKRYTSLIWYAYYGLMTSNKSVEYVLQDASDIRLLRLKVFAGHNLAKKDIFGASDPYVRIDLIRNADDSVIDSVYTKTKKKVIIFIIFTNNTPFLIRLEMPVRSDIESKMGGRVHIQSQP